MNTAFLPNQTFEPTKKKGWEETVGETIQIWKSNFWKTSFHRRIFAVEKIRKRSWNSRRRSFYVSGLQHSEGSDIVVKLEEIWYKDNAHIRIPMKVTEDDTKFLVLE